MSTRYNDIDMSKLGRCFLFDNRQYAFIRYNNFAESSGYIVYSFYDGYIKYGESDPFNDLNITLLSQRAPLTVFLHIMRVAVLPMPLLGSQRS